MDFSKQIDIPFSFKRALCFILYVYTRLLSYTVGKVHLLIRLEFVKTLQNWLYRKARELNAIAAQLPPVKYDVEFRKVVTPVGEDVQLHGDLYLPKSKTSAPVILIRTPYDKDSPILGKGLALIFAERGFACLVQDTRGRFGSDGDFFPVAHEVKDGVATVEWLRKQSW